MAKLLSFVKDKGHHNVAVRSDMVAGFDRDGGAYIVYLKGGGSIRIRAGQYEYKRLVEAMQESVRGEDDE